jgi:hypothetical protein
MLQHLSPDARRRKGVSVARRGMFVRCRDGLRFLGDLREKPLGILPTLLATGGVNNAGCAQRAAATLPVFLECHPQDISTP